jgi:hypothetical protein
VKKGQTVRHSSNLNPLTRESSESAIATCGHNRNNPPFDFTGGLRKATVWASNKKFQDTGEDEVFAKAAAARQERLCDRQSLPLMNENSNYASQPV